jgi:hypothetical protein
MLRSKKNACLLILKTNTIHSDLLRILRIDYASHYIISNGILPFSHKLLAMAFSRFPTKFDRLLNLPTDIRFEANDIHSDLLRIYSVLIMPVIILLEMAFSRFPTNC